MTGRSAPRQAFTATTVRGLLVGLGLSSLVGMPTQSPLVLLWFMLLVAWLTVALANADVPRFHAYAPSMSTAAALLSFAYAAAHVVLALGSLSVPARAIQAQRPLITGTYSPEAAADGEFRWTRANARFLLPVTDRFILLRLRAEHPDIAQRPVRLTVSTPCATLLDLQLTSTEAVTLGLEVPDGQPMARWDVKVSRTFQPSGLGGDDRRHLGVAVRSDFTASADRFKEQQHTAVLSPCLL